MNLESIINILDTHIELEETQKQSKLKETWKRNLKYCQD